ncbi:MAG: WecB/TagA/CpsF family glycosyltransferase [Chroococcidiopsidaceae cyanobacterium CP_BM_RX_35]|nr:WecB/TagA/CpsF family glycosyltransferase [Chroococcidiopsidaceae cyanobacterium CP_BM_RX_35]
MRRINILNIWIDNLSKAESLEQITHGVVFTPNVDHLIKLQSDREFFQTYSIADYKLCDSQILVYASRFLGTPIKEKLSGSDFFPAFYTYHSNNENIRIFLLGGERGVASKAQYRINRKVGRNIVIGSHSPSFGFEKKEEECLAIVEMINNSGATVLAIGVGAPKQEKWIYKYRHLLPNIKIFLAIGATINFEAGNIKRAPKWLSDAGLEWLYRLLAEPRRLWKRYLIEGLPFFWLVWKQKFNSPEAPIEEQTYELSSRKTVALNKE